MKWPQIGWPEEPGKTVITSARKHEKRVKAGPSRKNTRHPHSAKANRFVVESKKHELYNSSGTYVQMTKIYENIR